MMKMKKHLSLLLALLMCLSLFSVGTFADSAEIEDLFGDVNGKLVIVHTNDVHGRDVAGSASYGTAAVAQLKKDLEAEGANVLLLSAGDAIQGLPLVNYSQGATAIEFMNAAGYDVMSPGNHEFDWGVQNLFDILDDAEFNVLAANIIYTEDNEYGKVPGEKVFYPNWIYEFIGLTVGVFGLTTPESATKSHPDKVKGVEFLQGEEMFDAAREQVEYLKSQGCDLIISVGHLGIDEESTGNRSIDLIEAVDGIDIFVDGHSHTVLEQGQMVEDTLLVSAGTALSKIGTVIYDPADGSISADLLGIVENVKEYSGLNTEVNELVNLRNAEVEEDLKTVIGQTEVLLYGKNTVSPAGVRVSETNLGDFAAEALLWTARQSMGEDAVDLALTNGGGIRDSIPVAADAAFPYDVTMKDMVTVFPFGNQVATVEITGAQLLEALEAATFSNPTAVGAFPQVAGIEFSIYNYIPYERGAQYPNSTYFSPANPGSRIRDVKIGGNDLDLNATYVVATNDFVAAGGDTYYVFKEASKFTNLGIAMEQAMIDYLIEIGGVVGQEYANPKGRITLVDTFSDIEKDAWYYDAYQFALANGIMKGVSDVRWAPLGSVTRAQVFQTFYNMEGNPEVTGENFPDVTDDDWFADAALWAKNVGLSTGNEIGFTGNNSITRAELAAVFARYLTEVLELGLVPADLTVFADDETIPSWAVDEMAIAVGAGIINGKENNLLDPLGGARRAELAQMHMNLDDFLSGFASASVEGIGYGSNLNLNITAQVLFDMGIEIGDILTVYVNGYAVDAPICVGYGDVDVGNPVVRVSGGSGESIVVVALNLDSFVETYGAGIGDTVMIALKEKGGYLEELELRAVESNRTNVREDYESDEVFANFREVTLGFIADGKLYRSSSPVNNELGRAAYADDLIAGAGIATVINLADSDEEITGYMGADDFDSPYYKNLYDNGSVIPLDMGVAFKEADFEAKLKEGIEFMLTNDGPYLVHCTEGKDRAGFVMAVLEALMGADADEIKEDYMQSFVNYFHLETGSEQYNKFAEANVFEMLRHIAGLEKGADLTGVDLSDAAYDYLVGIGLDGQQIEELFVNLSDGAQADFAA